MGRKERERRWNGAGKGYFMADKKPASYLSVPQVIYPYRKLFIRTASVYPYCKPFIRTASRLSAQSAFICSNRIRTASLFRTNRVCLRRKRLPLAVFLANETPRV